MKTILALTTGFLTGALAYVGVCLFDDSHTTIDIIESVYTIIHKN